MAVIVNFFTPGGPLHERSMGAARIREDLALGGTSTAATEDGEGIFVANNESSMVAAAVGTTPDAATTTATAASGAGVGIPAGQTMVFFPATGAKINVKAL